MVAVRIKPIIIDDRLQPELTSTFKTKRNWRWVYTMPVGISDRGTLILAEIDDKGIFEATWFEYNMPATIKIYSKIFE